MFCILERGSTVFVIIGSIIFNKSLEETLVNESICVISIIFYVVLFCITHPIINYYFDRIRTLLALRFLLVVRTYLRSTTNYAEDFLFAVFTIISSTTILTTWLSSSVRTKFRCVAKFTSIFNFIVKTELRTTANRTNIFFSHVHNNISCENFSQVLYCCPFLNR